MVAPPSIFYRFAIRAIGYLNYVNYVKIRLQTPYVCHLFLHYTQHTVLKHPRSRTIRGITVPWGVYFCFTGFKTVEQEEAGDSLLHTFTVPDWPICVTMNMITTGTVAGEESPSCGPIFSHHNPGPPAPASESQLLVPRQWSSIPNYFWGQRLMVPNRFVTNLSFYIVRVGFPGGTLHFQIRGVLGDTLIDTKEWGNSNDVSDTPAWHSVTFDSPPLIDEEVYLLAYSTHGFAGNALLIYDSITDVKPNEYLVSRHPDGTYRYYPTQDFGYLYTYRSGWVMG